MRSSVPASLRFSMQSQPPDKGNTKIGKFISSEKRNQLSQIVKKSSLTFGHSANQTLTTSQRFYSPFKGQTHTSPPSHNISQLRNKNNRTHFSIGRQNESFQRSTTSIVNYNLNKSMNDVSPAGAAAAVGGSLSASHVNIGSIANPLSYKSEAKKEFSSKIQNLEKKKVSSRDMANNLSAHHYSFGNDANQLRTSAQLQFKPYKGYFAAEPASTNEKRTESHIKFGESSPIAFRTNNDHHYFRKSFDTSLNSAGKAKLNANMEDQKKTNFAINHASSHTNYITTNKAHYLFNSRQSSPLNNTIELSSLNTNSLRQSHIQLGNAARDYSPASRVIGPLQVTTLSPQKQLPPIPEVYKNSNIKVRQRLNNGTLTIGHPKLHLKYQTTYQKQAKNRNIKDAQPQNVGKNMCYNSNFTLNQSFPNYYSSQSKQSFASPAKFNQVNKQQYIGRLKTHHFNLGTNDNFDGQTCQKRDFQYSGDPLKLRSKIDPQLLSDLTNTHFTVGSHLPDFRTNNQSYEANGDSIRIMDKIKAAGGRADGKTLGGIQQPTAKMLNRKKLNLGYRVSGAGNGSTGEQDFVTINQANFNWIQPEQQ